MKLYTDAELAQILNQDIFHQISAVADEMGVECYVVGGYVRDIFLERPSNDIDVVVVGKETYWTESPSERVPQFRNGTGQVHGALIALIPLLIRFYCNRSGICGGPEGKLQSGLT